MRDRRTCLFICVNVKAFRKDCDETNRVQTLDSSQFFEIVLARCSNDAMHVICLDKLEEALLA